MMPSNSVSAPAGNGLSAGPGNRLAATGGWERIPGWQPPQQQPGGIGQPMGMGQWHQQLGAPFNNSGSMPSWSPRSMMQLDTLNGGWAPLGGWPGGLPPMLPQEPEPVWQPTEINA